MEFLDKVLGVLDSVWGASAGVALVLDMLFRYVKTKKPLSVLWVVSDMVKKVASVLDKVAQLLDKVLPQRTDVK